MPEFPSSGRVIFRQIQREFEISRHMVSRRARRCRVIFQLFWIWREENNTAQVAGWSLRQHTVIQ